MKTYISDILPKIKRYSQKLDNMTLLLNKHWVLFDDKSPNREVYIFRAKGELLISKDGQVMKGKWDILSKNSILIDAEDQSYLFNHGFLDQNLLALKLDGKLEFAVFLDENSGIYKQLITYNGINKYLEDSYGGIKSETTKTQEKPQVQGGHKVISWIIIIVLIVVILMVIMGR